MSSPVKSPFEFAAWLVDLDGTLYHHNVVRSMMAIELALSGWPAVKTLRTFRREHEKLRHAAASEDIDPFAVQVRRTAERLNTTEAAVSGIVNEWMIERPGKWLRTFRRRKLIGAITRFRAQGGRTAIVSDYPARQKLAAMRLVRDFDVVVACGEPGGPNGLKPLPAGYLLAARQLGMLPQACLVIGDRHDADGEAARQAGMAFQQVAARWPK